jgi:hypothetical protein
MKMRIIAALFFLLFIFLLPNASADLLKDENLLCNLPDDYIIGFQNKQKKLYMIELVPKSQTVENWTEMLTIQTFYGGLPYTPEGLYRGFSDRWTRSCSGGLGQLISKGNENGYDYAFWLMICPLNSKTGKPEYTWFKAIRGNDSFYVVQKAWKYEPSKPEIEKWSKYLRKVSVCDSRIPGRECPKVSK